MEWHAWVGPAIVAAAISGVISLLGLYVGGWIAIRQEKRRRLERVRDFQIALRAEIRSELHSLMSTDFNAHILQIEAQYTVDPAYRVRPSHPARHVVFEALVGEIHILPEAVIDDVILYSRQRSAIETFITDIRDGEFQTFRKARQLEMYRDLIDMQRFLMEAAERSVQALDKSLGTNTPINNRVSGPSGR